MSRMEGLRLPRYGRFLQGLCVSLLLLISWTVEAVTWQTVNPSPQGNDLNGIVADANQYVAVGNKGVILTSTDGATWVLHESGTRQNLTAVTYNGNANTPLFIAVGSAGTILKSSDGVTWQSEISGTNRTLHGVGWSSTKALFLVVGDGGTVLTSPDGVIWTAQFSGVGLSLRNVLWDGNQFLVGGDRAPVGGGTAILTSPDGVQWTSHALTRTINGNPIPDNITNGVRAIASNGAATPTLVATGNSGLVLISTDGGVTWNLQSIATTNTLTDVLWDGNKFIAVTGRGTLFTSSNGINWTAVDYVKNASNSTGLRNWLHALIKKGTQIVAVGQDGVILTTSDSINWTSRQTGPDKTLFDITTNASVQVAATQMIAVGQDGYILSSTDGVTWTRQTSNSVNNFYRVLWDGTRYLAMGNIGLDWKGTAWLSPVELDPATGQPKIDPATNKQIPLTQMILSSTNGVTWTVLDPVQVTPITPPPNTLTRGNINYALRDVAWDGQQYVAVGRKLETQIVTDNTVNPPVETTTVLDAGVILTSADAVTWTERQAQASTNQDFNGIVWSPARSQFVAVGNAGLIRTSTDAVTWSIQTSNTSNTLFDVDWDGTRYVAVGDGGTIIQSTDGVAWSEVQNALTTARLKGIRWTGTHFLAVGEQGTILSSKDGLDWIDQDSRSDRPLNSIAVLGGRNVVLGYGGTILNTSSLFSVDRLQLSNAKVGVFYQATLTAREGTATNWTVTGLPAGLTLDGTSGVISGTPTQAGAFTLNVQVTDNSVPAVSASRSLLLTVDKGDQTINFTTVSSATDGQRVALSATATSNGPVTFVSSPQYVCQISGSDVLFVSGGICSIKAEQLGNANYKAAPAIVLNVSVNDSKPVPPASQASGALLDSRILFLLSIFLVIHFCRRVHRHTRLF